MILCRVKAGLWVDSFWRSESIVTVLGPNSPGLRPTARYQLAQRPDRLKAIRWPHNIKVWAQGHPLGCAIEAGAGFNELAAVA
jgi:hypothetical protein